jgi:hypothetical protein
MSEEFRHFASRSVQPVHARSHAVTVGLGWRLALRLGLVGVLGSLLALAGCSSDTKLCTTEEVSSELTGDLPIVDGPKTLDDTRATFCWKEECGEMTTNRATSKLGTYSLVDSGHVRIGYLRSSSTVFADGEEVRFTLTTGASTPTPRVYELRGRVSSASVIDDGCHRYTKARIVAP